MLKWRFLVTLGGKLGLCSIYQVFKILERDVRGRMFEILTDHKPYQALVAPEEERINRFTDEVEKEFIPDYTTDAIMRFVSTCVIIEGGYKLNVLRTKIR